MLLTIGYEVLAFTGTQPRLLSVIYANLFITISGVYAQRGVYFALLEETRIPHRLTGTAVGLISVVGYTPDVFFAPIAGRLLDRAPGIAGHQHFFLLLAGITVIGAAAVWVLRRRVRRTPRFAAT